MLAWAYGIQGNYDDALPVAQKAVAEDPTLAMGQLVLGRAMVEAGDTTGGFPHLEKVLQLEPGNLEAHLTLAKAYSRLGRKDDARRERLLCLELSPEGPHPVPLRNSSSFSLQSICFFCAAIRRRADETGAAPALPVTDQARCRRTRRWAGPRSCRAIIQPWHHPKMTFKSAGYTYTVETRNGQSLYTVSDGAHSITIPILWAGSQAQTWVLERNGKLFESQVSYYPSINGLDITTGDDLWHPKNLEEAVGRPIGDEEAKACFGCHTTGAVVDHKLNLAAAKPGVTCEHCHVGASAHFAGVVKGDMSTVPPKLGKLTSEDLSNFCGKCHRSWETVVRSHWRGQADVRFQPYRLANSKCFDGTDPRISCVACHDPHKKLVRDSPAYYDPKCLACHAPSGGKRARRTMARSARSPNRTA